MRILIALAVIALLYGDSRVLGASRQCFKCKSRGELGDCRDPFPFNGTTGQGHPGIHLVSCPSGWCSKTMEGIRGPPDDYGSAIERTCLIQAPSDGEERCAETLINFKPSLVCFCRGELCNTSSHVIINSALMLIGALILGIL